MGLDLLPSVPRDGILDALQSSYLTMGTVAKLPRLVLSVSEHNVSSWVMEDGDTKNSLNVQSTAHHVQTKAKE